ncbi:hypothetical protein LEP1GSC122_0001 [Leptospira kirschneri serovar Valbuzzi str. 200702274]|nr:hypothetical protein LEP1GSC122_0001 [Leptospira kirschneri serovar Valbuzzi str. 200702274]
MLQKSVSFVFSLKRIDKTVLLIIITTLFLFRFYGSYFKDI